MSRSSSRQGTPQSPQTALSAAALADPQTPQTPPSQPVMDPLNDISESHVMTVMPFVCQRCRRGVHIATKMLRPTAATASAATSLASSTENSYPIEVQTLESQVEQEDQSTAAGDHQDPLLLDASAIQAAVASSFDAEQYLLDLFCKFSEEASIDMVMCRECLDAMEQHLVRRLDSQERKAVALSKTTENLRQQTKQLDENRQLTEERLAKELEELQRIESAMREELQGLEQSYSSLLEECDQVDDQRQKLDDQRNKFWHFWIEFVQEHDQYEEQHASIELQFAHRSRELQRLNTTNIFNDAFHIWFEGFFGTINNFRMGKLNSTAFHQPVEWHEINAAWGQACLLLSALEKFMMRRDGYSTQQQQQPSTSSSFVSQRNGNSFTQDDTRRSFDDSNLPATPSGASGSGFRFTKYRPVPSGSCSRMELIGGGGSWDLVGGGGGLFWQSRFDKAMVAFLFCVKELSDYANKLSNSQFEVPYPIDQDKIGHTSIKFSINNDENWTKACKMLLCDLKYLVLWCSSAGA